MQEILNIQIPTATTNFNITNYHIQLTLSNSNIQIFKRYSEFYNLHSCLLSTTNSTNTPLPLPPKTFSYFHSPAVINTRRLALEQYLIAILRSKDNKFRNSPCWLQFFNLQPSNQSPQFPLEYEKCTQLIHDIKSLLRERDLNIGSINASAITAANAAANKSKKLLQTLDSYITSLDKTINVTANSPFVDDSYTHAWLQDQNKPTNNYSNPENNKQPVDSIGIGEMQRRANLLENLKQQAHELESLLENPKITSTSFSADRAALFSTKAPSRRKFGVLSKETDDTRPMDTNQLLDLQNDLMNQQDHALDSLSSVIERQKQIGMAIGSELDYHNSLLENVDETLTKVSTNLSSGEKKLNRILKG